MLLFIITSSLNSLLPTRALCGCMDNPLVQKTSSTGAGVSGIQKIFLNSSSKSANSFYWLLAKFLVFFIASQALVSWSSMTRTFLRDNNTVSRELAIVPSCDLLCCVTYDVIFLHAYATVLRPSVIVICLYGVYRG